MTHTNRYAVTFSTKNDKRVREEGWRLLCDSLGIGANQFTQAEWAFLTYGRVRLIISSDQFVRFFLMRRAKNLYNTIKWDDVEELGLTSEVYDISHLRPS